MATALTSEYTRFTDKCNKVLAGGIVKTFEPNSLTPKISYQDPNKEIPNLTEVRLDETGRAKIYIDGDYRIQVYSRDGVLIEDNLLVEQSLVQRDFTSLSQVLELEQQEKLNQFQAQANEVIAQGFYKGFATEVLLLAAKPTVSEMRARADDTRKIYRWNRTSAEGVVPVTGAWIDTGLSDLDQAKADATAKASAAEANANKFATSSALNATANINKTNAASLLDFTDANGDVPASLNANGEFEAQDFKTETGSLNTVARCINQNNQQDYVHLKTDAEGNILFGIKQDGAIESSDLSLKYGVADLRADSIPHSDIQMTGIALDKNATKDDTAYSFEVEVSPYQADGTEAQRMAAAIKIGKNRLYVAYTQFSVYNNDQQDGRLVARIVDYDLVNKTATVSETIPIIGNKTGNNYRHPHFIRLKDRILLIFNGNTPDLWVYESIDNCSTWQLKTQVSTTISEPWALALDSVVRIEEGMYAGRIVAGLFNSPGLSKLCTVYSDDDGVTWKRGQTINNADYFPAYPNLNEISIACDAQNNLIFAIRNETLAAEARYIIFAKSIDGGHSLQFFNQDIKTATVGVQIGMKQIAPSIFGGGVPKIIATHPIGNNRTQFMLRVSYDGCKSWAYDYMPWSTTEIVGYSTLIPLSAKDYALVTEKGLMLREQSVAVKFLNLKEIM